jgi:hypothetical protein
MNIFAENKKINCGKEIITENKKVFKFVARNQFYYIKNNYNNS